MTPKDVLKMAKEKGARIVDLRFIDLPGLWQHFSIPVSELSEGIFSDGLGFDGSSIRGFQTIDESDMLLIPDPSTAQMDPYTAVPTLVLICNVKDPITGKAYTRDPRYVAQKAEAYVKKSGAGDTVYIGPELEFFFFDAIRFDQSYNFGYYFIDSEAGAWNSGREGTPDRPNLGYKPRYKQGYFPVPPMDHFQDIRSDMVLALESVGIRVEVHHHEVATGGQTEIDMRFDTLTKMADRVCWYKYCAKNTAKKWGKTATFMPKPLFQDNGSGMHTHQSLWRNGKNLFYERGGYADISKMCLYYIGGILKHAPALLAFIAPSTNSYKRLVPGYEAPINLVYSQRNRSAAIRIPMYSKSEGAKRIEFRTPDPTCNPYLSFAACVMAGLVVPSGPGRHRGSQCLLSACAMRGMWAVMAHHGGGSKRVIALISRPPRMAPSLLVLIRMGRPRWRVLIVDDHAQSRAAVAEAVGSQGGAVVGNGSRVEDAVRLVDKHRPDVLLMAVGLPDGDGVEAARRVMATFPCAIVLLTSHADPGVAARAVDAGVLGFLIKPLRSAELGPALDVAVTRFSELEAVRNENEALKQKLESRKLVDRAKGLLMTRLGLSEPEAFRRIQKTAMDTRKTMADVAQALLLADGMGPLRSAR